MRTTVVRVGIGAFVLVLASIIVAFVSFSLWRQRYSEALARDSEVAMTTRGAIEYATVGEGTPFLTLHGTPGGYDQTLNTRKAIRALARGSMTIAVSRPGYLRTPLESGATFEAQADLYAALLDELGIDRVVMYAASGGGYAGLQFALRHPERCIALVLYAPSVNYEPLPADFIYHPPPPWLNDLIAWSMSGPLIRWVGPSYLPGFDANDPTQVALARGLMQSIGAFDRRAEGVRNDLLQRDDPAIDHWPLEQIHVPTLLIHGTADENSDYAGSVDVAGRIPGARLVTLEGADHFAVITRGEEVRGSVDEFVHSVCEHDGGC